MIRRVGIVLALSVSVCFGLWAQTDERPDALAAYRSGNYEEAVRICLLELESMPRNRDSYSVLGWSLLELGRYEEAVEYGLTAYGIAPNDPRLVEILGEAYFYLGQNIESLRYFERYAVLDPTGSRIDRVYYFMGEIFIRLGEYNHADIALTTAVYHSPNVSSWWSRLGYAREMSEDYTYALRAYDQALALNSGLNEARRGRERVQERLNSRG